MTDTRRDDFNPTVDADGTIVADTSAAPTRPGTAATVAFAVAFVALLAIVVATALTGPAGATGLDGVALAPARDVQFTVVDPAAGAPGQGALVLLTAMTFGMVAAAGVAWRAFARALVRPRPDPRRRPRP
jgi:hypothetical protein